MSDFRMELHGIHFTASNHHGGDGGAFRGGNDAEALRHSHHLVAMAHPHIMIKLVTRFFGMLQIAQQHIVTGYFNPGIAELGLVSAFRTPPSCRAMVCMP